MTSKVHNSKLFSFNYLGGGSPASDALLIKRKTSTKTKTKSKLRKKKIKHTPILKLSSEIRSPIWSYIPENERKTLRLVCKSFQQDIDTKLGLPIYLDERRFSSRNVNFTLPPTSSRLRVWGCKLTHDYIHRLLLNPNLIRQVFFSGPIHDLSFNKILRRCENLISLQISDRAALEARLKIPLKLRSIKTLHLGTEGHFDDYSDKDIPATPWLTFKDVFENITFPCLKVLHFEYKVEVGISVVGAVPGTYNDIINTVVKFLISHKNLNELSLRIQRFSTDEYKTYNLKDEIYFNFSPELPLEKIGGIQLKKLIVSTDQDTMKLWELILPQQSNLEYLDFLNQSKEWSFFNSIIKKNSGSLKTVRLRKLVPIGTNVDSRIDLTAFESCGKLDSLFLSRFDNSTQELCFRRWNRNTTSGAGIGTGSTNRRNMNINRQSDSLDADELTPFLQRTSSKLPELIKIRSLPITLKALYIQGFTVKTEELSWIPIRLKNLELLELQLLGYHLGQTMQEQDSNLLEMPRDLSTHGLGVTNIIIKGLVTNLRKLDELFVEEWYNNRTWSLKDKDFQEVVKEISLIPGDCVLRSKGYFGVMIAPSEPIFQERVSRPERPDLWDVRFNQYRFQKWILEKKNALEAATTKG